CGVDGFYTKPSPNAPPLVNATLAKFPNIAFHWCDYGESGHSYYMRTSEAAIDGVCLVHGVAVFSNVDPDGQDVRVVNSNPSDFEVHWFSPPSPWSLRVGAPRNSPIRGFHNIMMALKSGECPTLEGVFDHYTWVTDISPQMFKTILRGWDQLSSSENSFDEA